MRRAMALLAASAAEAAAAAWEPALRGALACREVRELLGAGASTAAEAAEAAAPGGSAWGEVVPWPVAVLWHSHRVT